MKDARKIYPVILAGGKGTRLWPLSRPRFPKQFLGISSDKILLEEAVDRNNGTMFHPHMFCMGFEHLNIVKQKRPSLLDGAQILLEPCPRNTAAVVIAAALAIDEQDPNGVIIIAPADHQIFSHEEYIATIKAAWAAAEDNYIATIGIKPTLPETGYGYIKVSPSSSDGKVVEAFVEKPDYHTALKYLEDGNYYWNSGIFVVKASVLLEEGRRLASDIYNLMRAAFDNARREKNIIKLCEDSFKKVESISFDYAIMEKSDKIFMVEATFKWSDLGSWNSIWEASQKDEHNNIKIGNVICAGSNNSIFSTNKLMVAIDVDDLVCVQSNDAIFISKRESSTKIKNILEELDDQEVNDESGAVFRPWGSYRVIESSELMKVKEITVLPQQKLSLQCHNHRSEHWIVIKGKGIAQVDAKDIKLYPGLHVFISDKTPHRLINNTEENLILIEIQAGSYFGEDDVIRLEDMYGRGIT
jgi:mannose-1-phosphate guanylyltransferase/mannose-6-phosphate isomerase